MTWITAQAPFRMPEGLTLTEQVAFCIGIIDRYRKECPYLRANATRLKDQKEKLEEEIVYWKKKYKEKEKENEKLKKEIEKLVKTKERYQIALFDHGNFKHKTDEKKKPKGGQKGHTDTNREQYEDYATYERKRIFAKTCGSCGNMLSRVTSVKEKILLDIVIRPEIVKVIIESERQWCGICKNAITSRDSQTLPFSEYGINTFLMTLVLRFSCHSSFENIATVMRIGYGLSLSKSDISNILKTAAGYLGKQYAELKEAIRNGEVMYTDETGWLIHGQKAWMWIMTNEKETVYVAAESRGKGIAKELYGDSKAYVMTDGLSSYTKIIPEEKHLYCWAHVLRFAFEETVQLERKHLAVSIREKLVNLYQKIRKHREWTKEQKQQTIQEEIDHILSIDSDDQTVRNIVYRVETQKEGLLLGLLVTEDGTNNLAERELRTMAIKRRISHGSDTYKGMETTAIIGSVMQTIGKKDLLSELTLALQIGIHEKYPQYAHLAYSDT